MECTHSLICDLAIVVEERVLLVRYSNMASYDDEPGWFLPDDELRNLEHPTRAATRIAREQLGLDVGDVTLGHIESFRGNDGSWHLSFHHLGRVPSVPEVAPGPDVGEARWFPLDALPPRSEVAHHGWALSTLKTLGLGSASTMSRDPTS
jgi:ADP-ribose pyrophosphatase YjhB (NUDIX family)